MNMHPIWVGFIIYHVYLNVDGLIWVTRLYYVGERATNLTICNMGLLGTCVFQVKVSIQRNGTRYRQHGV